MCVDEAVGCQKRPAAFFVNISQQIHFVNGIMMVYIHRFMVYFNYSAFINFIIILRDIGMRLIGRSCFEIFNQV